MPRVSRTQKCVTLSTTVAEYMSLLQQYGRRMIIVKEAFFTRQYYWRFVLSEDTQGVIQLAAQNRMTSSMSKHIDVRHHFICQPIARSSKRKKKVGCKYMHACMHHPSFSVPICLREFWHLILFLPAQFSLEHALMGICFLFYCYEWLSLTVF